MIQPKSNWDEAVTRLSIDAAKKAQRSERAAVARQAGTPRNCGECLMDAVIVQPLDARGICPRCGANYGPEVA